MTKKELRDAVLKARALMSPNERVTLSRTIFSKITSTSLFSDAETVFAYVSFDGEVVTREFIEFCLKSGKRVAVPRISGGRMEFYFISSWDDVKEGTFHVPEPLPHLESVGDSCEYALMIMPGVVFDISCSRIGYGGGYYDRYLAVHTNHRTVAVAYDVSVYPSIPSGPNDIKPETIVTETRIYGREIV